MLACYSIILLSLWHSPHNSVYAFSTSSRTGAINNGSPSIFTSISNRQVGILDGSELSSLNNFNIGKNQGKVNARDFGVITLVAGTTEVDGVNRRAIGLESTNYSSKDKSLILPLATIPDNVSDLDAISTAIASLVSVHCCIPTINKVGGSDDEAGNEFVSGKSVVLGGSEFACFAARAMGELGVDVTLVSTGKPNVKSNKVSILPPVVGELELGFSEVLGQFDSMLDTLYDENDIEDEYLQTISGVVKKLEQNHNCKRYVSTCNKAQKIIRESGVLFGPNEVKEYEREITSVVSSKAELEVSIPSNFGSLTLQKLLDSNVIFPAKRKKSEILYRGWSLKDFWEYTSWPRNSEGGINSRFGLPVTDDIETLFSDNVFEEEAAQQIATEPRREPRNPFVMDIRGVEGLQNDIVSTKTSCIVFLSASYCRTCKVLTPQYTRMARISREKDKGIVFAKAETGSKIGKALGRSLGVNAVPTFVLFRHGVRYGPPLSVSKIPSKKLDLALDYLASGMEWDTKKFQSMQ